MHVGLVVYGALDDRSGGYLYDRMLADHLRGCGDRVDTVSFPERGYARGLSDNWSGRLRERLSCAAWDALLEDELNHPSLFLMNRRLKTICSRPIIAVTHHLKSDEALSPGGRLLCRALEKLFLGSVDGCICNSAATAARVAALAGRGIPTVVAFPGADGKALRADECLVRERIARGGPLNIVFIGNLIPRKGLGVLIEALARLPDRPWTLEVIGSGGADPRYAQSLVRLAARRCPGRRLRFRGRVGDNELRACLKRSHVLAVPSSFEGCGIVYLEALSCGVPVIGARRGGAGEAVRDGLEGFLVAPGDSAAVAGHIRRWEADRGLLLRMSLNALRRSAELPRWAESMAKARAFLEAALGRSS